MPCLSFFHVFLQLLPIIFNCYSLRRAGISIEIELHKALCVKLLKVHVKCEEEKLVYKRMLLYKHGLGNVICYKICTRFKIVPYSLFSNSNILLKTWQQEHSYGFEWNQQREKCCENGKKSHCVDEIQIYASINSYLTDMLMRLKDCTWSFDKKSKIDFRERSLSFYFILNRKKFLWRGT